MSEKVLSILADLKFVTIIKCNVGFTKLKVLLACYKQTHQLP